MENLNLSQQPILFSMFYSTCMKIGINFGAS
jgi:hypothetical protein